MNLTLTGLIMFLGLVNQIYSQELPLDTTYWYPQFAHSERVVIRPFFFVPTDVTLSDTELRKARENLARHLEIAQDHYRKILNGPSFMVQEEPTEIFQGAHNNDWYAKLPSGTKPDSAHRILKEILDYRGEDRFSCHSIFLVLYVRPPDQQKVDYNLFGGGRTINGPPGSGGGYVEMEFASLQKEIFYRFQSTLVHELGHAFGLTHSTILGESLEQGKSIMSYNKEHWSTGFTQSSNPGILLPEEIMILSANQAVFPGLQYNAQKHGQMTQVATVWNQAMLGPMDVSLGSIQRFPGVGYELYYNDKLVNGPESCLYTRAQAEKNLAWSLTTYPNTKVEGFYNATKMPLSP